MFTGGAVGRMAIFALGIMPYISASIIVQLMASMVPSLQALKKEGEAGRKKINQYTRYGTVFLATFQAYGLAIGLEAEGMAHDPGWFFRIGVIITLVGGTMFLMWLGEQITARGIGNGISPHHLRRHRRRAPGRARAVLHPGPHRRAQPGGDHRHHGDGGGGDRLRGLRRARACARSTSSTPSARSA